MLTEHAAARTLGSRWLAGTYASTQNSQLASHPSNTLREPTTAQMLFSKSSFLGLTGLLLMVSPLLSLSLCMAMPQSDGPSAPTNGTICPLGAPSLECCETILSVRTSHALSSSQSAPCQMLTTSTKAKDAVLMGIVCVLVSNPEVPIGVGCSPITSDEPDCAQNRVCCLQVTVVRPITGT